MNQSADSQNGSVRRFPAANSPFRLHTTVLLCLITIALNAGCVSVESRPAYDEVGEASWYGEPYHGRPTANGEKYNMNKLTAAHQTLPFDTKVRVTNLRNGRRVTVRINDRSPLIGGRIIDLSRKAAKKLNMIEDGVTPVGLEILN